MTNQHIIFSSFLAGLWEGDGHIGLANNKIKPYFAITFNIKDEPLAKKLQECLGGTLRYKTENNAIVLTIRSQQSLLKVVYLLHGKLRSPKIYEFNQLIKWLNLKLNLNIALSEIDKSNINSNAWLAGFIDADGSFKIRYQEALRNEQTHKTVRKNRIAISFVLEQRKLHPKTNESFQELMQSISSFFNLPNSDAKVHESKHNQKTYYKIEIFSLTRLIILYNYLIQYELLSSKKLDFDDWSQVLELIQTKGHLTDSGKTKIFELKQQINNKRKTFTWIHLNSFFENIIL